LSKDLYYKHIDIVKKDGKLSVHNMNCDCGYKHNTPELDIYIKRGAIDACPDLIAQSGLGSNVLIVADGNTYDIAAKALESRLKGAGYSCRVCVLPGKEIEPTPENAEYVLSAIKDSEFLLGVGSGVITDLTRRAAFLSGLPFAVFGTAASMDAYTSVTSSMLQNGTKVSVYGKAAKLLMFDPAVLAGAPMLMQAAGVGDMFAKYNVLVDWKLGNAVAGEIFCPLCEELLTAALEKCSSNIDGIAGRTEAGMEALIESLLLGGLTMLIVGNTRPCSSVEHSMAHYWEMCHIAYGTPAPSHGLSAGLALVYTLLFHEILKSDDFSRIDKLKIREGRMSKTQKEAFIMEYFPPKVGEEVMNTNQYWYLEWPEHEKRIDSLAAFHEQYKMINETLPGYKYIIKCLKSFGAPASASEAGISPESLEKTLLCTKDFRPRYNCASALSELGLLEESVIRILDMEKTLTD
jgi:glycerol-1-phosphate dehydrogenase [NAD(P)+]